MNLFNRIFTIITILILIVVGLAVILMPPALQTASASTLGSIAAIDPVIRAGVAILFTIILFFLLWLEVRRPGSKTVEVVKSTGSRIRITTSHVEERLGQQIDALGGVIKSRVKVGERDGQVVTELEVVASPGLDIVAKGEEIAAIVRMTVADQLGLKLYGKPQITIKTDKVKSVASVGLSRQPVKNDASDSAVNTDSTGV